jgi:chemotaxis protein MotB
MSRNNDERAEEIIIVRRRHEEDDHHHGGVWKIAFADFMTAMMAFFLVMWLINAANTETQASVASYFNPNKLTDSVMRKKGLLDLDEKSNADIDAWKSGQSSDKSAKGQDKDKDKNKEKSKAEASDKASKSGREKPVDGGTTQEKRERSENNSAGPQEAGRAFRDPFAPFTSSRTPANSEATERVATANAELPRKSVSSTPKSDSSAAPEPDRSEAAAAHARKRAEEASALLKQVRVVTQRLGITGGPAIDVTIEDDNIVMSLTDTTTFGMFAVGSAEPNELLTKLMQGLTPILSAHGDQIILRGHTDARPYRSDARNNNWRLAMARAEAAYAMLLRSGIEETRFERIEAHADRRLKLAAEPQAAANRRIEIIMRRSAR